MLTEVALFTVMMEEQYLKKNFQIDIDDVILRNLMEQEICRTTLAPVNDKRVPRQLCLPNEKSRKINITIG